MSSSLFSVRHVWPSPPTRLLYYLSMSASNALGALLALRLADIDTLPRSLTTAYAVAAASLILLRQARRHGPRSGRDRAEIGQRSGRDAQSRLHEMWPRGGRDAGM